MSTITHSGTIVVLTHSGTVVVVTRSGTVVVVTRSGTTASKTHSGTMCVILLYLTVFIMLQLRVAAAIPPIYRTHRYSTEPWGLTLITGYKYRSKRRQIIAKLQG